MAAVGGLVLWVVFANRDDTTARTDNLAVLETSLEALPTQAVFTEEVVAGEPIPAQFVPPLAEPVDLADVPLLIDGGLMPALNPHTYDGPRPNITYDTYIVQRRRHPQHHRF